MIKLTLPKRLRTGFYVEYFEPRTDGRIDHRRYTWHINTPCKKVIGVDGVAYQNEFACASRIIEPGRPDEPLYVTGRTSRERIDGDIRHRGYKTLGEAKRAAIRMLRGRLVELDAEHTLAKTRLAALIAMALVLAACTDVEERLEHVTYERECRAELWCEDVAIGVVIDEPVCVADVAIAHGDLAAECSVLGVSECAGSRFWRCEITCGEVDRLPCLP